VKKVVVATLVIIVVAGVTVVLTGWYLSARLSGNRLERVEASPHYRDGRFVNFEPEAPFEVTWAYVKEQLFGEQQRVPPADIPVVRLAVDYLRSRPAAGLSVTWLGHATALVEIDGQRILTDPVLSLRVSPFQFVGPERFHPPPIALGALRGIDAVVVSHSHYDHLDEASIRHLADQGTVFLIPLGTGAHLESWGIAQSQIHELDWWGRRKVGVVEIVATPARHYSGRGLFDFKATLWASWSILGPNHRVFYSGDTGYSGGFREIGERFGPFDLNIIKIGAYGPGAAWRDVHMPPEAAIQVHLDVGGKSMLGVHWGTFDLALHAWDEPIRRALAAADAKGVRLLTPRIGETVKWGEPINDRPWWLEVR